MDEVSNKLTEIANRLLDTKLKPNEQIIKVLKGELLVPAKKLSENFIPNLKTLVEALRKDDKTGEYHFRDIEIANNDEKEVIDMNEEIVIDEQELIEYIASKVELSQEDIATVLDLEFEFLKNKGVVE